METTRTLNKTIIKSKRQFSVEEKVKILNALENGKSRNEVRRLYDLPHSTLLSIIKNRNKLLQSVNDSSSQRQRIRNSKCSKLDTKLLVWYNEQKSNGNRVTRTDLMEKMTQLSNEISGCNIRASSMSWVSRFCYRHGIKNLDKYRKRKDTIHNQTVLDDEIIEDDLSSESIGNNLKPSLNDAIKSINIVAAYYNSRECNISILKSILDIEDDLEKILWSKNKQEKVL